MTTLPAPRPARRADLLARLARSQQYDLAVVGGGATGLGVALDAAARGFSVVLLESHDFAKGTSSRTTKLVHGGVRYLAQGHIGLVRQALHERATLLRNAPHLAQPLPFVLPSYRWRETPWYGMGLLVYDALAGKAGLGGTEFLGPARTLEYLPTVRAEGLKGGIKYWDGQFDDARLALALARTAASLGALVLNHCPVRALLHEEAGKVTGLVCRDAASGQSFTVRAHALVNATGVWVDSLRQMDGQALGRPVQALVTPSQGMHIVVDRSFLPSEHALMVPRTADGRVLFAVPWLGKLILGTTDSPRQDIVHEPAPFHAEVRFILQESARYLRHAPGVADIRSLWVGLRPLVRPRDDDADDDTGRISREHLVRVSRSGLVSVTGGKWTTYRAMAEDVLQQCFAHGLLPARPAGVTEHLPLVGAPRGAIRGRLPGLSAPQGLHSYGSEAPHVQSLPGADTVLGDGLSAAMVRFAARHEYACTVEDMLARRSRCLFLDARQAIALAPAVARLLHEELGTDPRLEAFLTLAQRYLQVPG